MKNTTKVLYLCFFNVGRIYYTAFFVFYVAIGVITLIN